MLLHANPLFFKELRNGSCMLKIVGHISQIAVSNLYQSVSFSAIFIHVFCLFLVRSVKRIVLVNGAIAAEESKNEGGLGRVA